MFIKLQDSFLFFSSSCHLQLLLFFLIIVSIDLSCMQDLYPDDTLFHRLVHLTLCTCETEWLNLLMRLLNDSPNLRFLKLQQVRLYIHTHTRQCNSFIVWWPWYFLVLIMSIYCSAITVNTCAPVGITQAQFLSVIESRNSWMGRIRRKKRRERSSSVHIKKRKMFEESNYLL